MKNSFNSLILIALGVLLSSGVFSQGVAINNDGSPAHASAMFDVQSTTSGMLIPRMTATERGIILNPATGLLVFQTDAPAGFYFYNGSIWTRLSAGLDVNGTQNYVTKFTSSSSLGNSIIYDNGTNVGIGTITPDYRFTVVDSTEGSVEDLGTTGFFYNASVADEDMGLVGICDNVAGKGMGVVGIGARYGVVGTSFLEGSGTRIGVFGNFDNFNAERKYAVVGHASGTGINYGIYGIAYGGSENWAGYFQNDVYVGTNLKIGSAGTPTAQLHTTGSVRFANYTNGFLSVDANGYLGVSPASSLFSAGTGLSWAGSTLNSVWTISGNNIYNNNTANVGIGTSSPGTKLDVSGGNIRTTNQLISTQATGTAPLAVSSTTMVTNLNSDLLDGNHASAFAAASHTHAASDVTSGEFDRARVRRMISADTRATNPNPDTYEPALQADFKQNTTDGLSDGGTYHGVLSFRPYGTGTDYSGGPMHQLGFTQNGNLWIRTSTGTTTWSSWKPVLSSTNISGTTNYVSKFTGANSIGNSQIFDNGTNVGVGFASPTYKLDVQGASGIRIGNTTYDANLVFGNNATWKSGIRVYDNGDAEMRIWHANANGQIVLATGYNGDQATTMPADGLFIDQNKVGIGYASPAASTGKLVVNGNVGIGTSNPGTRLDVTGGAIRTDNQFVSTLATGSAPIAVSSTTLNTNLNSDLLDGLHLNSTTTNNQANTVVRTDGNGYANFGWINTISGDNGTTSISRIYASNDAYIRYYTPANFINALGLHTGSGSANYLARWTSSSTLGTGVTFDNGTNVGIGNYSPAYKLHIGAGNGDGIIIGNYNDQLGWNGAGAQPELAIRFAGYRDVVSNFTGAKISAIRTNICCSGLSQGTELAFFTQETTATGSGDANLSEKMRIGSGGNVGIGTTSPLHKLDVTGNQATGWGTGLGHFINNAISNDVAGVYGSTNNTPYYGFGGYFLGGFIGVRGESTLEGNYAYGVYGQAYGNYGYGVYGVAYGNSIAYGVYSSGDFTCTGTKSATVKTEEGPKELYCQESPENWFEDFGSGVINNGKAVVNIKQDYLMTVTISEQHSMKVFITPNGQMGNWWVEKKEDSFIVYAPDAQNGTEFDFRVVAKRKGYEDIRLKDAPGAYTDKFLYPTVNDVPARYREDWLKLNR